MITEEDIVLESQFDQVTNAVISNEDLVRLNGNQRKNMKRAPMHEF
jgi:GR25 family glycosyltransferase involved in LPS biosynthesis